MSQSTKSPSLPQPQWIIDLHNFVFLIGVLAVKADNQSQLQGKVDRAISEAKFGAFAFRFLAELEVNGTITEANQHDRLIENSFDKESVKLTRKLNDLAKIGQVEKKCVSMHLSKVKRTVNEGKAEINTVSYEISTPLAVIMEDVDKKSQEMETQFLAALDKIIPECMKINPNGNEAELCVENGIEKVKQESSDQILKHSAIFKDRIAKIEQLVKDSVSALVTEIQDKLNGIVTQVEKCIKDSH